MNVAQGDAEAEAVARFLTLQGRATALVEVSEFIARRYEPLRATLVASQVAGDQVSGEIDKVAQGQGALLLELIRQQAAVVDWLRMATAEAALELELLEEALKPRGA